MAGNAAQRLRGGGGPGERGGASVSRGFLADLVWRMVNKSFWSMGTWRSVRVRYSGSLIRGSG